MHARACKYHQTIPPRIRCGSVLLAKWNGIPLFDYDFDSFHSSAMPVRVRSLKTLTIKNRFTVLSTLSTLCRIIRVNLFIIINQSVRNRYSETIYCLSLGLKIRCVGELELRLELVFGMCNLIDLSPNLSL